MHTESIGITLPLIRIITAPRCEAPLEIRTKWINIEIPCLYFDEFGVDRLVKLSDSLENIDSYVSFVVFQVHAIDALKAVYPDAAAWWKSRGFPVGPRSTFAFSGESVEPLGEIPTRSLFYQLN